MRRALVLLVLGACGGDDGVDPCASIAGTCLAIRVESPSIDHVDELELDILHADLHDTVAVPTGGEVSLPLLTAIALRPTPAGPTRIDVVAAGLLDGAVLGTAHGSNTLGPDQHGVLALSLAPPPGCDLGTYYCGGVELSGAVDTVYECTATVPTARGRCPGQCVAHPTLGDTCAGVGGTCIQGGLYCGGDKLDGDPSTLYECSAAGTGINPEPCARGCVVAPPGSDDACRVP
jgi:hypothetical protein